MITENINFRGAGKLPVHGVIWTPDDKHVEQVLHVIHGMTEYTGRYKELAAYFVKRHYAVCMIDLAGHGQSVISDKNVLNVRSWTDWVYDTELMRLEVKNRFPDVPYQMMGFSLGSFIVRAHQHSYPSADKMILVGTGQPDKKELQLARIILMLCCRNKDRASKLVKKLAFDSYNSKISPKGTEPAEWLICDPTIRNEYLKDENVRLQMSARFFDEFLKCMIQTEEELVHANFEILLISGSDDPVSDVKHGGLEKVEKAYKDAGADVNIEIIEGYRHDILHDTCRQDVFEKIDTFCQQSLRKENAA